MSKRKHHINVSTPPNTKDKEWLMENVPMRTLTRWKKRFVLANITAVFPNAANVNESIITLGKRSISQRCLV